MKNILIVTADTNDGDYIEENKEISDVDITKLKDILSKTKRLEKVWKDGPAKEIRFETMEMMKEELHIQHPELTEEECEFLEDLCPSGNSNYPGIHTIESIRLLQVQEDIELLNQSI